MPTTSVVRIIAAPRDQVWAALADVANAGRWNTHWTSIEFTSQQHQGAGTSFRAHTADGQAFEFEITHWAPPEYIAFAPIRGQDEGRYILTLESHAFALRPEGDDHTRVELIASASSHGPRGWLIGLLLWAGHQKQGLNAALDGLQALFEPPTEEHAESEAETPASTD